MLEYFPNAIDVQKLEVYLDGITDWKHGTKADGTEIKRLQKWHDMQGRSFTTEWKTRPIPDRWESCPYDPFLLQIQQ